MDAAHFVEREMRNKPREKEIGPEANPENPLKTKIGTYSLQNKNKSNK